MADDYADLGAVEVKPEAENYSELGAIPLEDHAKTLADDPNFEPTSHYAKNPSAQTLTEAREVFKKRAQQPIDWGQAATGFAKGAIPAVVSGVASMARGLGGAAANVFTADLNPYASKADQDRAERENAAALQMGALHGKDLATGLGRNIMRLFGHTDKTLTDEQIEQRIKDDAAQKLAEEDLAKGEVDGPGFGGVSKLTSPEELAAQGSPIRPERIGDMSFIADPSTFAAEGLGKFAGPTLSKFVTAPILKGAGKAASTVGKAAQGLSAVKSAVPAIGWLMHSHNPIQAGAIFSAEMAAKHVAPAAGDLLSEAGAEAAGAAPPVGQSLARKALKGAATGAVTGATLGLPFAAAAQSPEEAGQAIGGGLGIGGALGAFGGIKASRQTDLAAKANQLATEGAKMNYGLGWEDEAHARAMANLPPEARDLVNIYRGRFNGMTDPNGMPIQIYALSGPDYTRALSEAGKPGGEGTVGFVSPDGTKTFINADLAKPGGVSWTLGHEAGGHLTEFLADIAQRHDISELRKTIQATAYNDDGTPKPIFKRFIDNYKSKLAASGVDTKAVDSLSPDYLEKEWLAEHAGKLLNGRSISDFNLPKPISNILMDGVNRWLENNGITRKGRGGKEGLKFDGTEIKDITRQLSDLLYKQGQQSEALRAQRAENAAKNVTPEPPHPQEIAQLRYALSKPITPLMTGTELADRAAKQKRLAELEKNAGQQTPTATQPTAAPAPEETAHRMAKSDATEGLRQLFKGKGGLSKSDATALVDKAAQTIGKSTDSGELLKAALQINSGIASVPSAPAAVPLTAKTNPPAPTSVNTGGRELGDAFEREMRRLAAEKENESPPSPVPPVSPVPAQEPAKQPVVATLPKPAQEPQAAPTREELRQIAKDAGDAAEEAVRAARTAKQKPHTLQPAIDAARDKAELEAMAKAHAAALPPGTDLVRMQTDRFGRTGIYGDRIDPSDPFHQELLDRAGYGTQERAKLRQIMARFEKPTGVEYLSAPDEPKAQSELDKMSPREQVRELRRRAQEQATAGERAAGEAPVRRAAKSFIPQSITFNPGSNSFTVEGFSPDKFLSNASKVIPWLKAKGIDTYSGVNDPLLIEDLNGVSRNHDANWRGDGSAPVVPSILTPATPKPGYEPYVIPKDRFDTLNALIADDSAALVNEKGEPRKGSPEDKASRAEKQVLAKSNSPFLDPATGETNRIRDLMKKEGDFTFENAKGEKFSGPKVLEQASESIRPDLIEKIGDPTDAQDVHKLRPSGVEAKVIEAITGTPRKDFAAAGFSPLEVREKLTPERLMVNIRNYGANRVSTKTPADYREAIAAHLGGGEQGSGRAASNEPTPDEQNQSIVQWADQNGVAIRRRPWSLNPTSKNNKGGAEHDAFFDAPSQRWIKTTKLGQYGQWPSVYRIPTTAGGEGELSWTLSKATPDQYLQRLEGAEKLFGIKTPVHGVIVEPTITGKMLPSIVTSQPDIQGRPMDEPDIENRLRNKGFTKIDDDSASYYRKSDNTAILDAHSGNLVVDNDGDVVGYDAIVMQPDGELRQLFERDHAKALARQPAPTSGGKSFMELARQRMQSTPEKQAAGFSPSEDWQEKRPTVDWEEFDAAGNSAGKRKLEGLSPREQDIHYASAVRPDELGEMANYAHLFDDPERVRTLADHVENFDRNDPDTWIQNGPRASEIRTAINDGDAAGILDAAGDEKTPSLDDIEPPDQREFDMSDPEDKEEYEKDLAEYQKKKEEAKDGLEKAKALLRSEMVKLKAKAATDYRDSKARLQGYVDEAKAQWKPVSARYKGFSDDDFDDLVDASDSATDAQRPKPQFSPSEQTPQEKARERIYMSAVESGDESKAQSLVDLAAEKAGYKRLLYHGTNETKYVPGKTESGDVDAYSKLKELAQEHGFKSPFDVASIFERWVSMGDAEKYGITPEDAIEARKLATMANGKSDAGKNVIGFNEFNPPQGEQELGIHLGTPDQASGFGDVFPFHVRISKPLRLPDLGTWDYQNVMREARRKGVPISGEEYDSVFNAPDNNAALRGLLRSKGYDGIVYKNEAEGEGDSYIAFDPTQIKSADPVTRDDKGNVIPLSQRFNRKSKDVRFSPSEDTGAPEDGGTPGERLAREAEKAGVVLKLDDFKGLMTMQQDTVDRIRRRIEQNTGEPARFSPSDEEAKKVFESAKKIQGVTHDIREAGYITPDGSMIDMSGRHQQSGYVKNPNGTWRRGDGSRDPNVGQRAVDHREIEWEGQPSYEETWQPMVDFMNMGAVRVDANAGMISVHGRKPLTSAQEGALRRLIDYSGKENDFVYVDAEDDKGRKFYAEYPSPKPARVVGDLRRWSRGEERESGTQFSPQSENSSPSTRKPSKYSLMAQQRKRDREAANAN